MFLHGLKGALADRSDDGDEAAIQALRPELTFTGVDFSIQHDGVCRMNRELARRVAQLVLEHCQVGGT